jgi:hypothetical protein
MEGLTMAVYPKAGPAHCRASPWPGQPVGGPARGRAILWPGQSMACMGCARHVVSRPWAVTVVAWADIGPNIGSAGHGLGRPWHSLAMALSEYVQGLPWDVPDNVWSVIGLHCHCTRRP